MKIIKTIQILFVGALITNCAHTDKTIEYTKIQNRSGATLTTLDAVPVAATITGEEPTGVVAAHSEPVSYGTEPLEVLRFDTSSSTLSDAEKVSLQAAIEKLRVVSSDQKIDVVGFADPRGSFEANEVLATNRALAVAKFIESHGVDASRVRTTSGGILSAETHRDARIVQIRVE